VPHGSIRLPPIFRIRFVVDVWHGRIPYTLLLHGTAAPHVSMGNQSAAAFLRGLYSRMSFCSMWSFTPRKTSTYISISTRSRRLARDHRAAV